jgi:hypothetical protein
MLTEKKKTAKKILLANLENFKKLAPHPLTILSLSLFFQSDTHLGEKYIW